MTQLKGIDVSHWQAGLDLAKTDAQFVIVKATQGTTMVDSQCDHFVQQAKKKGIPYGVYHFAERGGTDEADWFVKNIAGYLGEAILVLDWEADALHYGVSAAKAFLDRVHAKTGVKPVIYTSGSVVRSYNWSPVANADYGLWIAQWSSSYGSTGAWKHPVLWQYTDKHSTGGMTVDGDIFYGNRNTWAAYATGGKTDTTDADDDQEDTQPTPKPDTGGDDVAGRKYVTRTYTIDQSLKNGAWQTIRVNGDKDTKSPAAVMSGPADIIGGEYNVAVEGLKPGEYALMRLFAADTDPDGPDPRRATGWATRLIPPASGGTARASAPIVWDLGGPAKGHANRNLRIEVKAVAKAARVSEAHAKFWWLKP